MPKIKYQILRYQIIHNCIANRYNPYPSKEKLREECEFEIYGGRSRNRISLSTIEKDLNLRLKVKAI